MLESSFFSCGKCSPVKSMVVWYRWPGVEIMFIEARAGHAILRRWRLVDKARTFMQDCYIAEGVISMQTT